MNGVRVSLRTVCAACLAGMIVLAGCASEPAWKPVNDKLIREHGVSERVRSDIPKTGVTSGIGPGGMTSMESLPVIDIAPGITGRIYWGSGVLVNWMTLSPGAGLPKEILPADCIMMVMKGSVDQLIGGAFVTMSAHEHERMTPISGRRGKRDFVSLARGAEHALKAGSDGAVVLEVYSPVRLDYLAKAGAANVPTESKNGAPISEPSVEFNRVCDYYNVQFSEVAPGMNSRLIAGKTMQLSFLRMEPNSTFGYRNQPEEALVIILRGWIDKTVLDRTQRMEVGDILYLPSGMVHGGSTGPVGCDALEIFWPVRPDYTEAMKKRLAAYHAIIPEDAEIELVVDGAVTKPGLCYCEGPSWVKGKLYFSSMGYDDRWNGDIKGSATVEMDPDGTYRYISRGIETNGTFPLGNGNLAVCDHFGHRVIEMTTKGRIVRILASEYDGKRLDGPNDIVVDDKGGIYFTDPQILPRPYFQPGRSVFYRRPDGVVTRVVDPGVLVKPNGLILSPDCKILYVNSTPEDFMMAYDVSEDGTISNPRKFGKIMLTPEILDEESINPQVDGMTVDELGNVYITSILGLQIFSPAEDTIGYIHFPLMPVNCCFGDEDGKTLYVICNDKIYKIRTKVRGAAYTLKRKRE